MPRFEYRALDARGFEQQGSCEAASLAEARAQLLARGLRCESLRPEAATSAPRLGPDAPELASHIAQVAGAGLPLESALEALSADAPSRRLRRLTRFLVARLQSGASLESALDEAGAPRYLRALVRAGEATGRLDGTLQQFASGALVMGEMRQAVIMALAYPALALCAWLALTAFILHYLVPQFESMFLGFGISLPVMTEWLLAVSKFARNHGWRAALVLVALCTLSLGLLLGLAGRTGLWKLLHALPGVGTLVRSWSQCRFAQLLALLVEQRIPLPEALPLAAEVAGDPAFVAESRALATAVARGESLEEAAFRSRRFSRSFVRALAWPAGTRGLPELLAMLSEVYAGRIRLLISLLSTLVPPLLLLLIAAATLFTVLALFLPLFRLLKALA